MAESVTPYPMTKVTMDEYYARWADKMTIFGGIPSTLLLKDSTSDEDFEAYVDHLFKAVAPGRNMIFGIADSTPPGADFDRLVRLGERIATEARLPIEAGSFRPWTAAKTEAVPEQKSSGLCLDDDLALVKQDVLKGDNVAIKEHVRELLDKGVKPQDILHKGMLPAMEVIGEDFKSGSVFIPEVLLSARAMNEATLELEPYLSPGENQSNGKVLIGTVRGDLHDIGKNIVITMLRGVGFEIKDLGINVPTETFVEQIKEFRPHILGISALLTTTMPEMRKVIEAVEQAGLRDQIKIMVGGAPVNAKFAKDIGADGYGADAGETVGLTRRLVAESSGRA